MSSAFLFGQPFFGETISKFVKLKLTMEKFLAWKILPRLMMLSMTIMSYQVVQWFMALGADATTQQAAFVSTVVGAMTGAFAVWMGHENK
mgnify:CR=1 FL=1